jgi:hypothetical protein
MNPPIVVIHGSGLDGVKEPYKRYLENTFRKAFKLVGTPMRIEIAIQRESLRGPQEAAAHREAGLPAPAPQDHLETALRLVTNGRNSAHPGLSLRRRWHN